MAKAEQEINVGGPWSDAVDRSERAMRVVGRYAGEARQVDRAIIDRARSQGDLFLTAAAEPQAVAS